MKTGDESELDEMRFFLSFVDYFLSSNRREGEIVKRKENYFREKFTFS